MVRFIQPFFVSLIFFSSLSTTHAQVFYGTTEKGGATGGGTIFKVNSDGAGLTTEYEFQIDGNAGFNADYCQLLKLASGKLYGVMPNGGANNQGVLYEYDPTANTYVKKADFACSTKGCSPNGSLVLGANGKLYGLSSAGGANSGGVIYEYDVTANTLVKKIDFDGTAKGSGPFGGLTLAANNKLYGMTFSGGATDMGVLFEYDPATNTFTKKLDFDGTAKGKKPLRSLTLGANNKLYGMTLSGGVNDKGVLFEFDPATSTFVKKVDFDGTAKGSSPVGSLLLASSGKLYGATNTGGTLDKGVLFEYDPSTSGFLKKVDFDGTTKGSAPGPALAQIANGKIYGTTENEGANNAGVLYEYDPATSTFTKKIDFEYYARGSAPKSGVTLAANGKLYGTTSYAAQFKYGGIWEYDPATSVFARKIDFNGASKGSYPSSGLAMASNGNLYGMTPNGGTEGWGVLFEYNPSSKVVTKKIDFNDLGARGYFPHGNLALAGNGKFYGMAGGGANNVGLLFEYDFGTNTFLKKVDFDGTAKGSYPTAGLVQSAAGKFYGIAIRGGTADKGVLFEYDPTTNALVKKVDFDGTSKGAFPRASLAIATNGKFYGTTVNGGLTDQGVLFEFDPVTSVYTKKLDFDGTAKGAYPWGPMILTSSGKMYGMTVNGGATGQGVLYEYDPTTNTFTKKIDFDNGTTKGAEPFGGLASGVGGKLYGMTNSGGANGGGVLFEFDPGTSAFTKKQDFAFTNGANPLYGSLISVTSTSPSPTITSFSPASGAVGATVTITGTNFSTTAANNVVKFGTITATITGTPTATSIVTTVPTGATTGTISVTVGGATATTTTNFTVNSATAPTITSLNPTSGSIGTSVTITGTNFSTTAANNVVKFGTITATITGTPTATSIVTTVPTGATTGPVTVTVGGQTASSSTFTISADATPPVITNATPTSVKSGQPIVVSITASDAESGITKAELTYGSANNLDWTEIDAKMTKSASGAWEYTITSGTVTELGVEYYVTVTNGAGGDTSTDILGVTVTYDASGLSVPFSGGGKGQSNYKIISIPLALDARSINAVFGDELDNYGTKSKWRMFRYSGSKTTELTGNSSINPGEGYWFISSANAVLDSGPGKTVGRFSEPFTISVSAGFNQIGNPYGFNLLWSDVQEYTDNAALGLGALRTFSGGSFSPNTILRKFEGGFVMAAAGGTLTFPAEKKASAGRVEERPVQPIMNSIDGEDWEVAFELSNGNQTMNFSGLGMNQKASDAYDKFDDFTVPRFIDYLELNHASKDLFNILYTKDIVPTEENHTWEFVIESNADELITLKWGNSYFGNNSKQLVLWDVNLQRGFDMRDLNQYVFNPTSSGEFKVYFGDAQYVKEKTSVETLVFHEVFPNPAKDLVTISFSVPVDGNVAIEVLDVLGKRTAIVANQWFRAGYNEVSWNTQDNSGNLVASGIYIAQIKGMNSDQQKRLIINK